MMHGLTNHKSTMSLVIVGNRKDGRDILHHIAIHPEFRENRSLGRRATQSDRHVCADEAVFLQVCVFLSWGESRLDCLGAPKTSLKLEYSTICDVAGKEFTLLFCSTCSLRSMLTL